MILGNYYAAVNKPEEAEQQYLKGIGLSPKTQPCGFIWGTFMLPGQKG